MSHLSPPYAALLAALVAASCRQAPSTSAPSPPPAVAPAPPPAEPARPGASGPSGADPRALAPAMKPPRPPLPPEQAPPPSPRLQQVREVDLVGLRLEQYFQGHPGRRLYLQTDKPLYHPGETIWLRIWDLRARSFSADPGNVGFHLELISPRGAPVLRRRVRAQQAGAPADLPLTEALPGGEYTLRVRTFDGHTAERPVLVSSYETPRLQMKLEFLRKAYGAGDEVSATIAVRRPTGEPLRHHPLLGQVRLDGEDLPRLQLRTDENGEGIVRFTLPSTIQVGDGLLTVLAEDGGLTESIARRVPILVSRLSLSTFPEGGHLVEGLPSRVYFEARNPLGKPADLAGRVVDDQGRTVARIESVHNGLGRFDLLPSPGRTYHIEVDRPAGVAEHYPLPVPLTSGCVLRSFDDLDGQLPALRVSVRCSEPRRVLVTASLRDSHLDTAAVDVPGGAPAVVYLQPTDQGLARAQGVARVTVLDDKLHPLAERLVYRNRRARLGVKVEPERTSYSPRDPVLLRISTTDPSGQPVPAEVALSVVDDTVLTLADDKTGHMLSRLYLEPELPDRVEEPNFYFDLAEEKSALALDLLLGTRGWRTFAWQPVLQPEATQAALETLPTMDFGGLRKRQSPLRPTPTRLGGPEDDQGPVQARKEAPAHPAVRLERPLPRPVGPIRAAAVPELRLHQPLEVAPQPAAPLRSPPSPAARLPRPVPLPAHELARARAADAVETEAEQAPRERWAAGVAEGRPDPAGRLRRPLAQAWAPVRVFPAPVYQPDFRGPRTDFRETIYFAPSVRTGPDGSATVRFYLSDAITAFRVTVEGVGAAAAGRTEALVRSSLPFGMAVRLPVEVSEGDHIELPLQLTNERERPLAVDLVAHFGDLLRLDRPVQRTQGMLAPAARETLFYPLTVVGRRGRSKVRFVADASGLRDEFEREVQVVPRGFPQHVARSGQLQDRLGLELDLGDLLPGTAAAQLRFYPSPVASMIAGLEGLLHEPVGCFEQASSTNYPNVMVLQYLRQQGQMDAALVGRASRLLDIGYRRLVGYETPMRGYEWFGVAPAHEALTAYGLMQFVDMQQVYPDVDREMVQRTAAWLRSRRDGKGGYLRHDRALDSFGRASKEVTDAYITFSLVEARQSGLDAELDAAERLARDTGDAYLLALSANSLLGAGRREAGQAAARRLVSLQDGSGGFLTADHSITRSGGLSLQVETTALAVLALLRAGGHEEAVRRGVQWLMSHRGGHGHWGSTQATVLALKALTAYALASRRMLTPGEVLVYVNGQPAGQQAYEAGRRSPLVFADLERHLRAGTNRIELIHRGRDPLPYSLAVDYRALRPASSPRAVVELTTTLERDQVQLGESVRLHVTVRNRTDVGQPMTLVRVGIPGGLEHQSWQLKELRDQGLVAFYETGPREVNLYLREMKPRQELRLPLDLRAAVPGRYTGPASRAYLYYTSEDKTWVDGLAIAIAP